MTMTADLHEKLRQLFKDALGRHQHNAIDHMLLSGHVGTKRGVSIFAGKIDSVEIADEIRIGVWLKTKGRWGAATLEQIREDLLEAAIVQACLAAEFSDPDEAYTLAQPATVPTHHEPDAKISTYTMKDFEKTALTMEEQARAFSPLVKNVPRVGCGSSGHIRVIANSEGVDVVEKNYFLRAGLSVMAAGSDERMVNCHEVNYYKSKDSFDPDALVDETAAEAIGRVEPRAIASGRYDVLFDPQTAAQLLASFSGVFSGDLLYRSLTRLEGRLGEKIAAEHVSLIEAGQGGLVPHGYDAEGTPCLEKAVIQSGRFETFLHNLYTAHKTGMQTTGNAAGALGEAPSVAPTNMAWGAGSVAPDDLLTALGKGLLVKELHGASASPISGDFSFGVLGYWVEEGRRHHAVADITLAGNFFDLLQQIDGIGEDLRYYTPNLLGSYGGRSLIVRGLAVAGQ